MERSRGFSCNSAISWTYELNYSSGDLLKYFLGARILEMLDGGVSFRLKAFLEYFAARRMVESPKFRSWITDEIRYLQFEGEIASYAAMSRRDEEWVDELVRRFLSSSTAAWAGSSLHVRDSSVLENLELPKADATEEEIFSIERRVMAEDLTDEGRRDLLNSSSTPEFSDGKAVNRPEIREPGEVWTTQLNLLSAMLKHMELIPKERKRAVLKLVLDGWLKVLALSVGLVPALAKEKHLTFNGIRYEIHFPPHMSLGEVTRRLLISMPISLLRIIHQIMGTDKLELQLAHGVGGDITETPAREQLLRVGLLSLLGSEGVADKLSDVGGLLKGNRYLSEVLLRQLYELAIRYRLDDAELSKVKKLAAQTATELESLPPKKRASRRSEIIRSLTKSRLLVEMGPNSAEIKKINKA